MAVPDGEDPDFAAQVDAALRRDWQDEARFHAEFAAAHGGSVAEWLQAVADHFGATSGADIVRFLFSQMAEFGISVPDDED